ncbi:MAG: SDR family oxidoreductase [Spirochaetales bacterium]|nr:SDR family oxidoreductase [Spirochaetales bacterium]
MEFENKRVLITGGTSGIGLAAAEAFTSDGALVCIVGRSEKSLRKASEKINSERLHLIEGDVSTAEGCKKIVTKTAGKLGGIDIVVNSAGIWLEGPAEMVTDAQWNSVMDTNLRGTFFICRHAIPYLEKSSGCIVNISSDSGLVGNDLAAVYCASKGGITLLTKSLAVELARKNIRVNAVCPGDVATPMLDKAMETYGGGDDEAYIKDLLEVYPERPGRRFTRPEEVARCILFLASGKVEAITGACLSIDFGLTAGY